MVHKINRFKTRRIKIGNIAIGAGNPVVIQSMAKTRTADVASTVKQILQLKTAGCEIIRVAIKDSSDALALSKIKSKIGIPLVADIHFDWRLAILAIENGADKIRLNPGNIHNPQHIKSVISAAKQNHIPIRIGVNSGSVKGGMSNSSKIKGQADLIVKSALDYIKIVERLKFKDLVISLKASGVPDTVEAYRKMSKISDYPLHLGVTATGLPMQAAVKSSIAMGILLSEGIGDTLRVSLTGSPLEEVAVAKYILEALELRRFGPEIISCPTCGRCEVDLVKLVKDFEEKISSAKPGLFSKATRVAIMGCVVNGPGEAKEADIGVAFGKKEGLLFKKGKSVKKVSFKECAGVLLKEMEKMNG